MVDLPELPFIDTIMRTIVFYDLDRRLPPAQAKLLIENICRLLNETPSHTQIGLGEGRSERRPRFSMLDKAIAKGDFDKYSYFSAVNYFQKGNIRDCSMHVGLSYGAPGSRMEVQYQRDEGPRASPAEFLDEVMKFLSPSYGILYDLTVREGPSWFAGGQSSSGMPNALAEASGQFMEEYFFGKQFKDGYFRDVFKWNYLSKAHLDKQIEGKRFEDWINEQQKSNGSVLRPKSRGKLTMLENGCAIWELTSAEGAEVRPRMLAADILMVKN